MAIGSHCFNVNGMGKFTFNWLFKVNFSPSRNNRHNAKDREQLVLSILIPENLASVTPHINLGRVQIYKAYTLLILEKNANIVMQIHLEFPDLFLNWWFC